MIDVADPLWIPTATWLRECFAAGKSRSMDDALVIEPSLSGWSGGLTQPAQPLIPAAVLVPLVQRKTGLTVLLTQRTAHLHDHAGQISFPGGRCEATDASPEATALR